MMEFVSGKDDIPYMKWKIKNVPNHQPGVDVKIRGRDWDGDVHDCIRNRTEFGRLTPKKNIKSTIEEHIAQKSYIFKYI